METTPSEEVITYLGLGSSLGDRRKNLLVALERLNGYAPEIRVLEVSPVYESPHLGLKPGDSEKYPSHYNLVARLSTTLTPDALLKRIHDVEEAGGRQRHEKWGPRTIDIDILLYGDTSLSSEALTLPHPGLTQRAFVVLPLRDLAPELRLAEGRTIRELADTEPLRTQPIWRISET